MIDELTIHERMGEVMRAIGAVGKDQQNEFHNYAFRGIDDVMNHLHAPLARQGVFVLPEVRDAEYEWKSDRSGKPMRVATLRVAFHFVGPDGERVTAVGQGEANANDDKASNKAMAAAFKYVLLYTFCIPTADMGDADQSSPELGYPEQLPDEVWEDLKTSGAALKAATGDTYDQERAKLFDRFGIDRLTRDTPLGQANALVKGIKEWLEQNTEPWSEDAPQAPGGDGSPPEGGKDADPGETPTAPPDLPTDPLQDLDPAKMTRQELVAELHLLSQPTGGKVNELRERVVEARKSGTQTTLAQA